MRPLPVKHTAPRVDTGPMSKLAPYLGVDVHVHVWPLDICASGVLTVRDGWLLLSTEPGFRLRLDGAQVYVTPYGPVELPDLSDVAVCTDDRMVQVWRDRVQPDGCGLLAFADAMIG